MNFVLQQFPLELGNIRLDSHYNCKRFRYFIGMHLEEKLWSCNKQRLKSSATNSSSFNQRLNDIKIGLEKRLSSNKHYDSISIVGPTEPTLSPDFDKIVDLTEEMRNGVSCGELNSRKIFSSFPK